MRKPPLPAGIYNIGTRRERVLVYIGSIDRTTAGQKTRWIVRTIAKDSLCKVMVVSHRAYLRYPGCLRGSNTFHTLPWVYGEPLYPTFGSWGCPIPRGMCTSVE